MKGPIGYKLSPNEEARLLKEAREALRKKRILQVREQAKINAAKIRQSVKEEKQRQLLKLAKEIENEWNKEKEEKLKTLKEIYDHSVKHIGEGHVNALQQDDEEDNKALLIEVDARRARIRHQNALKKLHHDVARQQEEATRHILARQTALELEKARAAEIASKPPPPPDPIKELDTVKVRPVKFTDLTAFSSTHYHVPEVCYVEKAEPQEQVDARELARSESEKLADVEKEQKRALHEQKEKARLRYKHALHKEILKQDYVTMQHDLSNLQRADLQRRQQIVSKIPKQIFIPSLRRLEEKEDVQRDMEGAFEDMYMQATEYFGDLSLALDPHPPPETPSVTESLDLSIHDPDATINGDQDSTSILGPRPKPPVLRDLTNKDKPDHAESRQKTPEGLRRLLNRIKAQRELAQKTGSVVDDGLTAKDSPSSDSTGQTLSQHPISDTSPSVATETGSQSTGVLSSNSGSTLTQKTLTTQSTLSTTSVATQETNKTDMATETTTEAESEQMTFDTDESTTSTVIDLGGTGNLESHDVLLHPLEKAAHVRQRAPSPTDMSLYLQSERQRQAEAAWNEEVEIIKQETLRSQQQLEMQKRLLEEKLQDIERQRLLVLSRMSASSSRDQDSITSSHLASSAPVSVFGASTFQDLPGGSSSVYHSISPGISQPPGGITPLSGLPIHNYNFGRNPATSVPGHPGDYGVLQSNSRAHPENAISRDQLEAELRHIREHQQQLLEKHAGQFNDLSSFRQQMAQRAQQLLQTDDGTTLDGGTYEAPQAEISPSTEVDLSQTPMTSSSVQSGDRQSMESNFATKSSVHMSGVSELRSPRPPVSDLESRFDVLEGRLHHVRVVQASGAADGRTSQDQQERHEDDSFERRQNELEAELDAIERQQVKILEDDRLQKEKIEHLKSQWFTMTAESSESEKRAEFGQLGSDEETKSMPNSPRKQLSFADSTAVQENVHEDRATEGQGFDGTDRNCRDGAKAAEQQFLLCHPQEVSSRTPDPSGVDFPKESQFSWPVLQRSNINGPAASDFNNVSKSGRTWHMELLECSTSSENSSKMSCPKKLPTPPETNREPLVFEIEGPHSPLLLHCLPQEKRDTSDSKLFASTPTKRPQVSSEKELKSPLDDDGSQHTLSSSDDPGPQQQQSEGRSPRHSDCFKSSFEGEKTKPSELSEYTMSNTGSELSRQWMSSGHELSQFSMSTDINLTPEESGHVTRKSEFRPLQSISEISLHERSLQLTYSNQQHHSNVESNISRQIEESLAQHRQLIEQTKKLIDQHAADNVDHGGVDQFLPLSEERMQATFSSLEEQTGILDEPDITLVSLDSTITQQDETSQHPDDQVVSKSVLAATDSVVSTGVSGVTGTSSATQSPACMTVMFRDPSASPRHQDSLTQSRTDPQQQAVQESIIEAPDTSGYEPYTATTTQHGIGARLKQVKFEITEDRDDTVRSKLVKKSTDGADTSCSDSDIISIHVQHMDGSSTDEYEGLSLREAFLKKKKDFIEASEKRKKKAEEKAKRKTEKHQQHGTLGKTLASWKKTRKLNTQSVPGKKRDPTNIIQRTSEQRKHSEREMKARTLRLYNQLEEVKQKKLEEERRKLYAQNREKAKAFYQKLDAHKKS